MIGKSLTRFRWWLWFGFGLVGLFLVTVQSHTIWLPWIAQHLIVKDRLRPTDVIVVFAAKEARARHAARLYRRGLAPRIIVTGGLTSKEIELFCRARVTGAKLSDKVLTDIGVPESAVIAFPEGTSTYEEAEVIKAFMTTNGYHSMIAVSSPYHMRPNSAFFYVGLVDRRAV